VAPGPAAGRGAARHGGRPRGPVRARGGGHGDRGRGGGRPGRRLLASGWSGALLARGADPHRVDELVGALFDQVADLQANGPTPAELAKVQEQLRRNREEALRDNNFWLWAIEHHFTTPGESPDGILAYAALLEGLQPADLQAAAQRFLPQDRYVRVALYPEDFEP